MEQSEIMTLSHAPYERNDDTSFSDNLLMNYAIMDKAIPFITKALGNIAYDPASNGAFTIVDYGTEDGGTSMSLMSYVISHIKQRFGSEQEVQVYYEDQPNANYNALFRRLHGLKEGYKSSYLKDFKKVFTAACGTGFYSQCVPTESVHLGFSATAVHWLSKKPCNLKSSVFITTSTDENEKKKFAQLADNDWELFLINRAKELVPGGYLVMANLSTNKEGQSVGTTNRVNQSSHETYEKHWRNMVNEGVITQEEFENTTFNGYFRTEEEFAAPFKNEQSAVYKSGLRLQAIDTITIPCPYILSWINSSNKDNQQAKKEHAKSYMPHIRNWSNYIFLSGLDNDRSDRDKCRIVDELFSRFEGDIANAPEEHAIDYVQTYLLITKK